MTQFQKWTKPKAIRTDNGEPFGVTTRDVVPIMSLWLKAYDIIPILNRPRTPQQNAKVERGQGTSSRWADVNNCPDIVQLKTLLAEACKIHLEKYLVPRLGNATRAQVFKSIFEKPRPFNKELFNAENAYNYLTQAIFPRRVSASGNITIYSKTWSVGKENRGKIMIVKFNPKKRLWMVFFQTNEFCKEIPDPRFAEENLFNLKCQ
jgi:transposase InsO family protein